MTRPVRIVADDLTGALDAAGPFSSPEQPVMIPWPSGPARIDGPAAATSESRNAAREDATLRALRTFDALRAGASDALWFKKVDSVLRGHPVAEAAALMRSGGFRHCIFAPAFPEMGRITRNGRQFVLDEDGVRPVGPPDLLAAFRAEGFTARRSVDREAEAARVVIVDAESAEDLTTAARSHAGLEGVLWVGSRGLAAALAGQRQPHAVPALGAVVVGTSHPVTRLQVGRLNGLTLLATATSPLHIDPTRPALIDPVPNAVDSAATQRALCQAFKQSQRPADGPAALLVVGGDTLSTMLDATSTESLECVGEVMPGIPISIMRGGRLDRVYLLSKSGGFGGPDLIGDLLRATHKPINQDSDPFSFGDG